MVVRRYEYMQPFIVFPTRKKRKDKQNTKHKLEMTWSEMRMTQNNKTNKTKTSLLLLKPKGCVEQTNSLTALMFDNV